MFTFLIAHNINKYKPIVNNIKKSFNSKNCSQFSKDFNEKMHKAINDKSVKKVINQLKNELGKIRKINYKSFSGKNILSNQALFEKGEINLIMSVDENNKISGLLFRPVNYPIKYPSVNKNTFIKYIVNPYLMAIPNVQFAVGFFDGKEINFF